MFKYFHFAALAALVVFISLFSYVSVTVSVAAAVSVLYLAFTLSIVETAVSFDNAVVNATHLHRMNAFWRKMFLTVGILIAVIGMRFYLPLQIVSIIGDISLVDSFKLAVNDGDAFAALIKESADSVHGFGGAFLLMVALTFFVDHEKDNHWIPVIEKPMAWLGKMSADLGVDIVKFAESLITLSLAAAVYGVTKSGEFLVAAFVGVGVFYALDIVKHLIEKLDERLQTSKASWIAGGLGTFIYLEILDASFSFDGVIAAFAISNNLFVIAAGLGVGALFVRSMTIMLDETGTLKTFKFMENGAFIAILVLAVVMFVNTFFHLPEWFVAVTSILSIGGATLHSYLDEKAERKARAQAAHDYYVANGKWPDDADPEAVALVTLLQIGSAEYAAGKHISGEQMMANLSERIETAKNVQ